MPTELKAHKDNYGKTELRPVEKGKGEGSRGGQIIGHTRSGKPIYGGNTKPQSSVSRKFEQHDLVSRKSTWKDTKDGEKSTDYNKLHEKHKEELAGLPHVHAGDDVAGDDGGHDDHPALQTGAEHGHTEFIMTHPDHGAFHVNTEGYGYPRYKTHLQNYPGSVKKARHKLDEHRKAVYGT